MRTCLTSAIVKMVIKCPHTVTVELPISHYLMTRHTLAQFFLRQGYSSRSVLVQTCSPRGDKKRFSGRPEAVVTRKNAPTFESPFISSEKEPLCVWSLNTNFQPVIEAEGGLLLTYFTDTIDLASSFTCLAISIESDGVYRPSSMVLLKPLNEIIDLVLPCINRLQQSAKFES